MVWPADDAVDLEASDLIEWIRTDGSRDSLAYHPGASPDIIHCRALGPVELQHVSELMHNREMRSMWAMQAFRYGVVSIGAYRPKRYKNDVNLYHMNDDDFGEILMDLDLFCDIPYWPLLRGLDDVTPEEMTEVLSLSMPHGIGVMLFNRSFRSRRPGI